MAVPRAIFDGLKNIEKDILKFAMLKIEHCNANYSIGFPDAQLMFKVIKDESHDRHKKILSVRFDTLFKDGVKLLLSAFENSDRQFETTDLCENTAVELLNNFIKKLDHYGENLKRVFGKNSVSETDISIALAEHLLERLAPESTYIVQRKGKCQCGCGVEPKFGSTGIGHEAVWHGHIDIILSSPLGQPSPDIAVKTVNKCNVHAKENEAETSTPWKKRKREGNMEETNMSPSGKSVIEVKHSMVGALEHTLAQTIVFSLLQKQKHPDLKNFLIPNILISQEEIQIIMYDAEYDVLLCSNIIDLFDPFEFCLNPETVIILWMVLHYRMFCTGLPPLLHEYKSHFRDLAVETWDIYSTSLKSGVSCFPVIKKPDFRTYLTYAKEIC